MARYCIDKFFNILAINPQVDINSLKEDLLTCIKSKSRSRSRSRSKHYDHNFQNEDLTRRERKKMYKIKRRVDSRR